MVQIFDGLHRLGQNGFGLRRLGRCGGCCGGCRSSSCARAARRIVVLVSVVVVRLVVVRVARMLPGGRRMLVSVVDLELVCLRHLT